MASMAVKCRQSLPQVRRVESYMTSRRRNVSRRFPGVGLTTLLSSRVVRDRPMKNMAMEMTWVMASPCDERASSVSLAGAWLVTTEE